MSAAHARDNERGLHSRSPLNAPHPSPPAPDLLSSSARAEMPSPAAAPSIRMALRSTGRSVASRAWNGSGGRAQCVDRKRKPARPTLIYRQQARPSSTCIARAHLELHRWVEDGASVCGPPEVERQEARDGQRRRLRWLSCRGRVMQQAAHHGASRLNVGRGARWQVSPAADRTAVARGGERDGERRRTRDHH